MATQDTVLEKVLTVVATLAASTPLTVDEVFLADTPAPRPTSAYITAKVLADVRVGLRPEVRGYMDSGTFKEYVQESRTATVSLQGYGADAHGWLDRFTLLLDGPVGVALTVAQGVTIRAPGSLTNVSRLRDTAIEEHWSLDIFVDYQRNSKDEPSTPTKLSTVVVSTTAQRTDIDGTDPDALTTSTTISTGA